MKRRFWILGAALLLLMGAAASYWLTTRETDFVYIELKTRGIQAQFDTLESKIDLAVFDGCRNVQQVLARLQLLERKEQVEPDFMDFRFQRYIVDEEAFLNDRSHRAPLAAPV